MVAIIIRPVRDTAPLVCTSTCKSWISRPRTQQHCSPWAQTASHLISNTAWTAKPWSGRSYGHIGTDGDPAWVAITINIRILRQYLGPHLFSSHNLWSVFVNHVLGSAWAFGIGPQLLLKSACVLIPTLLPSRMHYNLRTFFTCIYWLSIIYLYIIMHLFITLLLIDYPYPNCAPQYASLLWPPIDYGKWLRWVLVG